MNPALIALLAILILSAIVAIGLARRKVVETPVKLMLFVGYFWLVAFIQLTAAALVYWWAKHSGFEWF